MSDESLPTEDLGEARRDSGPLSRHEAQLAAEASASPLVEPTAMRPWIPVVLALAACAAYVIAQIMVFTVILVFESQNNDSFDFEAWLVQAETSGFVLAVCTIVASAVVVPLFIGLIALAAPRSLNKLLALHWPGARTTLMWIFAAIAFVVAADGITWLSGREVVPHFMREAYKTAGSLPLLCCALLIAAPVTEELIFRGLLFHGLIGTRLGLIGACILTSLAFASMHLQYDMYYLVILFAGGLLLAAARYATRSIVTCILMHSVWNLVALAEVAWVVARA